jgi:hypothetical protein
VYFSGNRNFHGFTGLPPGRGYILQVRGYPKSDQLDREGETWPRGRDARLGVPALNETEFHSPQRRH